MNKDLDSIIEKMTLEEKAKLCSGRGKWQTKSFKRLDIPAIMMSDGPHGLRKEREGYDLYDSVEATCFPTAASLASSWDRDLIYRVGKALGEECQAEGISILLGPGTNIKRSPLCGRNFEYFSEDPYLASEMATEHIKGVQSQGVGTSLKHFAANNQEHRRMTINAEIDERTLREIYLPAFEKAVKEAGPWTVMCAYNRVNGEFCSENKYLLTDILKEEWGHEGFVVSDWGAVNDRVAGLKAGLDLEMPSSGEYRTNRILEAVEGGRLSEKTLNEAVRRILKVVFKAKENEKHTDSYDKEAHHSLAREAAADSMVLLKNDKDVLPLGKSEKIAVLGPFAKNPRYQGGGSSHVNPTKVDTAYEALQEMMEDDNRLNYAQGYSLQGDQVNQKLLQEASRAAEDAEVTVIFAGLPRRYESEGYDRTDLALPPNQNQLIKKIANQEEKVVVVLSNGAPVEMPWVEDVEAVLESYLGGQASGSATANILMGKVNPSGKLAETFPKKLSDTPAYLNFPGEKDQVRYQEGIFVGYRYYDTKDIRPLFPFGHGLSYTKFDYGKLEVEREEITADEELKVSLPVKNVGSRKGKEVVQLYVRALESEVDRPEKELKGFAKVELEPGESKEVTFTLNKRSFAYYNTELEDWHVESGKYHLLVGSSSQDIRQKGEVYVHSTRELDLEITPNTTVGDLLENARTEPVMTDILNEILEENPLAEGTESATSEMFEAVVNYLPLRALISFADREISKEEFENYLTRLNEASK